MPETVQYPKQSPDYEGTDLGDEYVFYDKDSDDVHLLNGTAREIYLLCDGKRSEEKIAEALAGKFEDVDYDRALRDTREIVGNLRKLGVLEG